MKNTESFPALDNQDDDNSKNGDNEDEDDGTTPNGEISN